VKLGFEKKARKLGFREKVEELGFREKVENLGFKGLEYNFFQLNVVVVFMNLG
jgi:hypothetical protein